MKKIAARRQLNRRSVAQAVVRGLIAYGHDNKQIGIVVNHILRSWNYYSDRQREDTRREWIKVLSAELQARELGRARDRRSG